MGDLGSPDERGSLEITEGMETRGLDDLARGVKMVLPELGVSKDVRVNLFFILIPVNIIVNTYIYLV